MKNLSLFLSCLLILAACDNRPQPGEAEAARMEANHIGDEPVASPAAVDPVTSVDTSVVVFGELEDRELRGYMVTPSDATTDLPAMILIHEWWGLNENIKTVSRKLAAEGYRVLAVDMYNGKVATEPSDAREYMQEALADEYLGRNIFEAAHHYLTEVGRAPKIGVMGWCFGGGQSLVAALALPKDIDASVIFYGRLTDDREKLATLEMPVLGLFGQNDTGIPVADVRAFEAALNDLGKDAEIIIYPDAGHGFANPSGRAYNKDAADDAWARVLRFLGAHLQN